MDRIAYSVPDDLVNDGRPRSSSRDSSRFLTAQSGVIVSSISTTGMTQDQLNEPLMYIELPQLLFWGHCHPLTMTYPISRTGGR